MQRLENGNDYIELTVTGYEVENCTEDWLMVYGKIFVNGKLVEGYDASVYIAELKRLRAWADELRCNKKTSEWFPTEPNLEFDYSWEKDELTVYFYPERSLCKYGIKKRRSSREFYFTKGCRIPDFEKIIRWCDEVLASYPSRNDYMG